MDDFNADTQFIKRTICRVDTEEFISLIHILHYYEFDPIFRIILDENLTTHFTYLRRTCVLHAILILYNVDTVKSRVLSKYTGLFAVNRRGNHSLFHCFRAQ